MKKKTTILFAYLLMLQAFQANAGLPFWQESFNADFPGTWSSGDYSGQNITWQQCSNVQECPPFSYLFCGNPSFRSPGFSDGYMYVDSYSQGPLTTNSQSYLRTEAIDCSGKAEVFIRFHTFIHAQYTNPDINAVLRVKAGNGPWSEFAIFPDLNFNTMELLQSWNAQRVQLDISAVAANQSNVSIEWKWTANYDVAWMIDDVALFDANPLFENIVWGQSQGNFSGGQNGWTVVNNPQLDSCRWSWVDSATIHLPGENHKADALACWPGVYDGAMIINASKCQYSGLPSQFSQSDLKSPNINLAAIPPGTKLDLKFNQAFSLGNNASSTLAVASVAVSINNGNSYLEPIEVNPLSQFQRGVCNEVCIRLPEEVAGKPQVRLKFIFSGDTDYWIIDDVRISHAKERDVRLNPEFYNVAPDFATPGFLVREISLFTQVQNLGKQQMTGVRVLAEVKNKAYETIFQDTFEIGTLQPDDDWTDVFFSKKFLPNAQAEEYICFYQVEAIEADQDPTNNQVHWRYHVTDTVFSKNEFCGPSKGYFLPTESVEYEIGNCYYIPKDSKLKATSMSFAFANAGELVTVSNHAQLSIHLYKWRNGTNVGDVNSDTIANPLEYELVSFNLYDVTGEDGKQVITVPISFDSAAVDLQDETYYFVTVGYLEAFVVNNVPQVFPIAGSEEINYTAMFYHSYLNGGLPNFVSMLREGDENYFRANAWALRRIPFVNLNVEKVISSEFSPVQFNEISLSPNPASEFVWLTADFPAVEHPIRLEIFDLCGRSVLTKQLDNRIVSHLPIDVGQLSNGSYILRVVCGDRIASKKLVIVH